MYNHIYLCEILRHLLFCKIDYLGIAHPLAGLKSKRKTARIQRNPIKLREQSKASIFGYLNLLIFNSSSKAKSQSLGLFLSHIFS